MVRNRRLYLHPIEEQAVAVAEKGVVILEGPRGLAVSFNADAARRTSESLRAAADEADRQKEEMQRGRR